MSSLLHRHTCVSATGDIAGLKIPFAYKPIYSRLHYVLHGRFESIGVPLPAAVGRANVLKGDAVTLHC